jgi:hypothetical protein
MTPRDLVGRRARVRNLQIMPKTQKSKCHSNPKSNYNPENLVEGRAKGELEGITS